MLVANTGPKATTSIPLTEGEWRLTGMSTGPRPHSVLAIASSNSEVRDYQLFTNTSLQFSTSDYNSYTWDTNSKLALDAWVGSSPKSLHVAYRADSNTLFVDSYVGDVTAILALKPKLNSASLTLSNSASLVNSLTISPFKTPIDALAADSKGLLYILYSRDRILTIANTATGSLTNYTLPGDSSVFWNSMALQETTSGNLNYIYFSTLSLSASPSTSSSVIYRFSFSVSKGFIPC